MKSARITDHLLDTLPVNTGKNVVLLNIPESLHGVPMTGANDGDEFKLSYNLLRGTDTDVVKEVYSWNMVTADGGAQVQVTGDSTLQVSLNENGSWLWYNSFGAVDYENDYYKAHISDGAHYELRLKKSAGTYLLLYQKGENWHHVDMNKRNVVQY